MKTFFPLFLFALPSLALAQPSGLEGSILIGPVVGGPTRQGAPDSKPLPNCDFVVQQDGKVVATFQTDGQGHFQISLGAGHYTVARKETNAMGSSGPFEVDVTDGKMKTVEWKCDSGIR